MSHLAVRREFGRLLSNKTVKGGAMFKPCLTLSLSLALFTSAHAFSLSCFIGNKCVQTQGTSIPPAKVVEILNECGKFKRGRVGRQVLLLSVPQINARSQERIAQPIFSPYNAFTAVYETPLIFKRKSNAQVSGYAQIALSCRQLKIDYENWLH